LVHPEVRRDQALEGRPVETNYGPDQFIEVSQLIVKVASRCNLNCDYCYMYTFQDMSWKDMPASMSQETAGMLAHRVAELASEQGIAPLIALHGGEPLLAGYELLAFLIQSIKSQVAGVRIAIQTNGTIYTQRLASLFRSMDVDLSISLDGFQEENDRHRLDHNRQSHYRRIRANLDRAQADGVLESILLVADLATNPERTYQFIAQTGVKRANIILRDGDHNTYPPYKTREDSTEAGQWLWEFFRLYASLVDGPAVRFFDTVARGILAIKRASTYPAHRRPRCILTIDTDGTVKQTDTFRINGHRADYIGDSTIFQNTLAQIANSTENRKFIAKVDDLAEKCRACRYLPVCGGGWSMHRMKGRSLHNPSIYCSDYLYLFERVDAALKESEPSFTQQSSI
jgi:uncharacterized protein